MSGLVLLTIILIVELVFKPRLDTSINGTFLWYGYKKRKYIKLF